MMPTGEAERGSDEEGSAHSGDDEDENEAAQNPKHLAAETQRVLRGNSCLPSAPQSLPCA